MDNPTIDIIGVYTVPKESDVKLVELFANCPPSHLDIGKFTQREENVKESDWQAAYDEHYLNESGTEVIGDFLKPPVDAPSTRLVFFYVYS